jgi:hypothetical protein
LRHVLLLKELLAETEICEFEYSVFEENVGGFQIAVENMGVVEGGEGVSHLLEDLYCLLFGKFSSLLEELCESAAIAVLVDEVEVVGGLKHLFE